MPRNDHMNMQIDLMHNGLNRMLNAYKSCRWNETNDKHDTLNADYATALSLEMLFMTLTAKTTLNWLMSVMSLSCFLFQYKCSLHFMNGRDAWSLRLMWIISRERKHVFENEKCWVDVCRQLFGELFSLFSVCLFATAYASSCLHGASRRDSIQSHHLSTCQSLKCY